MKTRFIHSSADSNRSGASLIEKIFSSDVAVILMAVVLVLVLVSLSGCAPVPAAASEAPIAPESTGQAATPIPIPPAPTETSLPTIPSAKHLLPQPTVTQGESALMESALIVAVAKKALGAKLGISVGDITFVSGEYVEWNTSCLGFQQPREMCLEVITPGYRVILMAQGVQYEVHTDVSGRAVRIK